MLARETVAVHRPGRRKNEIEVATLANGAHHWQVRRPIDLVPPYQVGSAEIVDVQGHFAGLMVTSTGTSSRGLWLSTVDEGKSWRTRRAPTAGILTDEHGLWLVGGPLHSSIYHSSNNGASWQHATLPVSLSGAVAFSPVEISGEQLVVTATNEREAQIIVGSETSAGVHWAEGPTLRLGGVYGAGAVPPTGSAQGTLWMLSGRRLARVSLVTGQVAEVTPSGLQHEGSFTLHPTGELTAWASDFGEPCQGHARNCVMVSELEATSDGGRTWHAIPNPVRR